MSRYIQRTDGEGFTIRNREMFKIACCDCGLVHQVVVVALGCRDGKELGFAARRDNRATAARRRKGAA